MGANESTPSAVRQPLPKMVDMEEKLKGWSWQTYLNTTGPGQRLAYNDVTMKVIWDNVHFNKGEMSYSNKYGPHVIDTSVIFQSEFENNTKEQQEYNFSTQRTTDFIATTSLSKGFTGGVNTGIEIPVPPDVSNVTSGFGNTIVIDTKEQNSVKHSLTWTANSNIRVSPYTRTVARLVIQQQVFQCDFLGDVTFKGNIKVMLTDKRTGQVVIIENDITQIVEDVLDNGKSTYNVDLNGVVIQGRCVKWPISGKITFKYGVSQKVVVDDA